MSLSPIESVQLNAFFSGGAFSGGSRHEFSGPLSAPPLWGFCYVDRVGAFIAGMEQVGPSLVGIGQFDPLFLDNTAPLGKFATSVASAGHLNVGEWDQVAAVQNIYAGQNISLSEFWPVDPTTLVVTDIGSSLWPFFWDQSSISLATIGGWDDGPASTTQSDTIFFETWGFALRIAQTRHTDGSLYRGLTLVDLTDGSGALVNVPVVFTATPAALFEAFSFQGDAFNLDGLQFVADDDSVPAAPKGRVFLHSSAFLSDLGDVDNTDWRQYMKIIEWNPLGVTPAPGNSTRVHLREVTFTRLNFIERQAFGTNPNSLGTKITSGTPSANGLLRTRFHPASRTFVTVNEHADADSEERGFVRTSFVPALSEVQTPTQLQEVETAKTVRWRARALGDIGDRVGGIPATWSIDRRSTEGETFDTSGAPAFVDVANAPIDAGTTVFYYNGTPLTLTTDYTVNEGTGRITGAGAHAPLNTSGYTADYRHVTVADVTPAHGTLLQQSSRTNELGIAETQVQYPDDDADVGGRDEVFCEMTDD